MSQSGSSPADFFGQTAAVQEQDFPEVPSNVWKGVNNAPSFDSDFNEANIFKHQYFEAARQYYESATAVNAQGRQLLKLFTRWADVVSQFTRHVLHGNPDDPLDATLSWDPEGGGEAMVRPLRTDSFSNAQYAQTPTSNGQFNIIPDNTQGSNSAETATANEQAWIIIGWVDNRAGTVVPYDYLQADVNDNVGVRREEFLKFQMEAQGTLGWAERGRGPLLVEPGNDLDVDVNVVETGIQTALWPVGIEVIRADATEFGGILG